MIIPGFIVAWLTFPGVMVHELAHEMMCQLTGTPVLKVCYFRFGNPAGYVIHGEPRSVWRHILIGVGPLFINSLSGFLIGMLAVRWRGVDSDNAVFLVLLWLAVSVAMHSFPSTGDARSIWQAVWRKRTPILAKLIAAPLVGLIFLGAIGSIFWLDVIYGLGVAVSAPNFVSAWL